MTLSGQQVAQYQAEGCVVAPGFFGAGEVAAMQAELARLREQGLGRNVATAGDGKTQSRVAVNLQLIPLSPVSPLFRALPFAAKVRNSVQQLLQEAFILQLDQIFLKPAGHGAGTSWHQDNAYFGIPDPTQGVGMWIAVHDATVANGTMHVVPGSHVTAREHVRDGASDHHITCAVDPQRDTIVPVEMEAGGVLFFNYGIAHCTKGNHTDKERAGLALHFLKTRYMAGARAGMAVRPHLAGPDYTGGVAEWGASQEGEWQRACGLAAVAAR